MMIAIFLIGLASACIYLRRRRWIDAALVLVAAVALAGLAGDFVLPGAKGGAPLTLTGDGLLEPEWRDLPARPLAWKAPAGDVLRLDFPRRLALGRMFTLTVRHGKPGAARLQLLAENRQVVAEASGAGPSISVQWLPPLAETLVLRARLLDAAGTLLAEGPVPLQVLDAPPLQVRGRFGAPSFDARVLNDLLAGSGAAIDWQVTLGKTVTRTEEARTPLSTPGLLLVDAAWFERSAGAARDALLAQVESGTPLVILGAGAAEAGIWSRAIQLELKPQPENLIAGAPLAMTAAPLAPSAKAAGAWTGTDAGIWTRDWRKGRIAWIGVADWHRYAISEPRQLALWWQAVLDSAGVRRDDDVAWVEPRDMPLAGRRLEVCARGVSGEVAFPELKQSATWQQRPDRADSSCVGVWPRKAGWLRMETTGARPQAGQVYVFADSDWPLWQAAQRRDATARHAARTPSAAADTKVALPAWPFAVLFALALLALWWRERRQAP